MNYKMFWTHKHDLWQITWICLCLSMTVVNVFGFLWTTILHTGLPTFQPFVYINLCHFLPLCYWSKWEGTTWSRAMPTKASRARPSFNVLHCIAGFSVEISALGDPYPHKNACFKPPVIKGIHVLKCQPPKKHQIVWEILYAVLCR